MRVHTPAVQMKKQSTVSSTKAAVRKSEVTNSEDKEGLVNGSYGRHRLNDIDVLPPMKHCNENSDFSNVPKSTSSSSLPYRLRENLEQISGQDLNNVRVHYRSHQPAKLNALAYTQGTDIHLGPGQEKHLPHEAWHVIQQKQGRVISRERFHGNGENEDASLEKEADEKGRLASHAPSETFLNYPTGEKLCATASGGNRASESIADGRAGRTGTVISNAVQPSASAQVIQFRRGNWWGTTPRRPGENPDEANTRKDTNRIRTAGRSAAIVGGLTGGLVLAGGIAAIGATGGLAAIPIIAGALGIAGSAGVGLYMNRRAKRRKQQEDAKHLEKYGVNRFGLPIGAPDSVTRQRWESNLEESHRAWNLRQQLILQGHHPRDLRDHENSRMAEIDMIRRNSMPAPAAALDSDDEDSGNSTSVVALRVRSNRRRALSLRSADSDDEDSDRATSEEPLSAKRPTSAAALNWDDEDSGYHTA